MLLDYRNEMAAIEVLQRGCHIEVVRGWMCLTEDSIAFDEELMHESKHLYCAKSGKLDGHHPIGVFVHELKEIVLEQDLFISPNDGISAGMR